MYAENWKQYELKGNARIKNTVRQMKNDFDGLISRLDMAKKRVNELEYVLTKTYKTEIQTGTKNEKHRTECPRNVGQLQKV